MGGIGRYLVTEYQMSHVFVLRDTESPLGKVTWLREMLCTYKVMLSENSGKSRVIHKVHVADVPVMGYEHPPHQGNYASHGDPLV